MLTVDQVIRATGCSAENVEQVWPLVQKALSDWDIFTPNTEIAAVATIGAETPNFWPVREKYASNMPAKDYFIKMYWTNANVRHMLGNLSVKDAYTYFGRGLVQITGRDKYDLFGSLCHLDLLANPDLALDPQNAADILAAYFSRTHIQHVADAEDWRRVRIRVNGGLRGWDEFAQIARKLGAHVVG